MKKLLCLLFFLGGLHYTHAQDTTIAKLDTLLSTYNRLYKFNGTALIAQHGRILLHKGYGIRNIAEGTRDDTGTIFQLGSVTKQFTAVVILKLEEEKKLSVQDKVSKYFPDFPKGDSITIQHLLTHTSGIYNYTNDRTFMESEVFKPASREKLMALFKDKPLDFSPGTKWNYSNSGYCLLGYIAEKAGNKPYEQLVREYIFNPLHMNNSGFDFKRLNNKEKSTGYFFINQDSSKVAPGVDSSVSFSAGAMYSTTSDLYKWHQAAQQHKILSKADWERAYTPVKNNYGYGMIIDSIAGKRRINHGGGIHGFITTLIRIPEDDVCIILLDNASDNTIGRIGESIQSILYNKPYTLPKVRNAISVPEVKLQQYTGEYDMKGFTITVAVKDGMLTGQPSGQGPATLYAEKEDFFFLKIADVQIKFTRDEKNEVNGIILYENDREKTGTKIK
ncbi:serine hydrolase [Chitinophaga filiformis]|uniref:CubicO group peptidase, beta-lactamase class C family n=1 Tax=Chitinophaga filiformis TaxID=104663 RepID=A0A1G7VFH2_CHIFI|nr:serine hydrolase [Chitinophaga filiformis]SDG58566.1 CubicO group peptidase, beta-lactamase class C family [Chitinophaga filiformis]